MNILNTKTKKKKKKINRQIINDYDNERHE